DDVMLVSGHNISTTEVESALVSHPRVAEAAVVGAADKVTGQAIVGFVILRGGEESVPDELLQELRNHVGGSLGPIAKPARLLATAENRDVGDTSTLTDSTIMDVIAKQLPQKSS